MVESMNTSPRPRLARGLGKVRQTKSGRRCLPLILITLVCVLILAACGSSPAGQNSSPTPTPALILKAPGKIFVSTDTAPYLQFPEGLTAWQGKLYTATYNVATPTNSRILVFDANDGKLLNTLGGKPGQDLINQGPLLGLTIDKRTGYLYCAANGAGKILQIRNAGSDTPQISVYATYPKGGGPEDLVFGKDGTLYASDSNLGVIYSIPPGGGGEAKLLIGPPGSGAPVSDGKLFASPVGGLSPNGIVFSLDWRTFYVANTWSDSIIAFDVNTEGQVTGNPRIFAQKRNDDLEEAPTGFEALKQKDTKIGASASTPLNGPDGLDLDSQGHIWVSSNLGDNLTVLDPKGKVIAVYGTSAVTQGGLLNQPSNVTWVGTTAYCSNLGIFTGLAGKPKLSWQIVEFHVGVTGAGGNGQW